MTPAFVWRPMTLRCAPEATARLEAILRAWGDTPYAAGQQFRGVGVDCVRFVAAVLDEWLRKPPTPIETLPGDAALHTRDGAIAGMKRIRQLYMPNDYVEDGSLEPGDIIVVGPHGGGPGHALIVGTTPYAIWHATSGTTVQKTGLSFVRKTQTLFRIYRVSNREVAA